MRGTICAVVCLLAAPAAAADWRPTCKKDAMTDVVTCQVVNTNVAVMAFFEGLKRKPTYVCIYANDFPGRQASIRIDMNKAIDTDGSGCVAAGAVLEQMKKGAQIRTRAYEWPYDIPKDRAGSLAGFAAAVTALRDTPITPE